MIALLCLGCVGEDPGDLDSVGSTATADTSIATETTDATAGTTDSTTGTGTTDTAGTDTAGTDTAGTGTDTTGTDTAGTGPTIDLGVLALLDVNATSATFDQLRHPDDYQGQISAWYFGHAT